MTAAKRSATHPITCSNRPPVKSSKRMSKARASPVLEGRVQRSARGAGGLRLTCGPTFAVVTEQRLGETPANRTDESQAPEPVPVARLHQEVGLGIPRDLLEPRAVHDRRRRDVRESELAGVVQEPPSFVILVPEGMPDEIACLVAYESDEL